MEDGILKRSLLSLEKIDLGDLSSKQYRTTIIYKHYILCFKADDEAADCVVIDTQKRTVTSTPTGLNLGARIAYSISHWKDNIFVIFGGYIQQKPTEPQTMFGGDAVSAQTGRAGFLHVIEEDSRITFKAISDTHNRGLYWNTQHNAHIYKDKLYIVSGTGQRDSNSVGVWRSDLAPPEGGSAKFEKCEIKSVDGAPRERVGVVSALLNDKIYVFGGYQNVGGLFGTKVAVNDLFALDLENMQWVKIQEENFLPSPVLGGLLAEAVGQKIYIGQFQCNEFYIYDPVKNSLQQSEGVSPAQQFMIKSHQDHSILFRINPAILGKEMEFQDFCNPNAKCQASVKEPVQGAKTSLLTPSRTNILSQTLHMNLLWEEKPFADVTFVVGSEEIQAHRIILLKCHYFQNMFKSGMMEASSNKINVPGISLVNFKAILEYIYFGKVTLTETLALDLIILADMYCMAELKADCEIYLSTNLKTNNLLKVIKTAETADSQKLEERIVSFLIDNIEKMQQEMDLREIPHELLVKSVTAIKQRALPSKPTNSSFAK